METPQTSETPQETASPAASKPVEPPTLPVVQRVPRKVLLIFGGVAAFFIWAAAFLTAPPKSPATQPPRPPAAEDDEVRRRDLKNFLDETRQQAATPPGFPAFPPDTPLPAAPGYEVPPPGAYRPDPAYPAPFPPSSWDEEVPRLPAAPAAPAPDPLGQALRSPLVPPAFRTASALPPTQPAAPALPAPLDVQTLEELVAAGAAISPSVTPPARKEAPASTSRAPSYDLAPAADRISPTRILRKGTVIPAVLEAAVNSDLPGQITALVARDVYDTATASTVLIPQGARLVGRLDSTVAHGQRRLFILWTDIVTPSGRRFELPDLPGADASGAAGLSGRTNYHTVRLFTGALLLSLVTAGAQLSQPDAYGGIAYRPPTAGEVGAGALGQRLGEVSSGLIERELKVAPTITIPPGTRFIVPITADILFPMEAS